MSNARRRQRLSTAGLGAMPIARSTAALARVLPTQAAVVGVADLQLDAWLRSYPAVAESPLFERVRADDEAIPSGTTSNLARGLRAIPVASRPSHVRDVVVGELCAVLRTRPEAVDLESSLAALGLDSLMALELRNRLERVTGLRLSATLVWAYPTTTALIGDMQRKLGASEAAETNSDPRQDAALARLTDRELEARLASKLDS